LLTALAVSSAPAWAQDAPADVNSKAETLPPLDPKEEPVKTEGDWSASSSETPATPTEGTMTSVVLGDVQGECDTCNTCDSCNSCDCCACPPGRFWIRSEALYWWINGQDAPPLVAISPAGTSQANIANLNDPNTRVLYGGDINDEGQIGGRFTMGYWFDDCQKFGFQGGFFFFDNNTDNFLASGDGSANSQLIGRPFFDANPESAGQSSQLVSLEGLAGVVGVNSSTNVVGADALGRWNLMCVSQPVCDPCGTDSCGSCFSVPKLNCCRIDILSGFRYFGINDEIGIRENLTVTSDSSNLVPGTTIAVADQFEARNNFYGYDIGAVASIYRGRWFVEGIGRVVLGVNDRSVDIFGISTTTVPGDGSSTVPGGLLAQPTNIGSYEDSTFAVLPEASINVGYQVTRHVRTFVGYTFLYLNNTVRAADAIDPVVNSTQIGGGTLVGDARPAFSFDDESSLWLQGVNVGVDVRF
jgi:hypothetical protein